MLNRDQIELIHREIDGANTPQESAAVRSLLEQDTEARALEADLRHVARLFHQVGEREPPPHLKQAILAALPRQAPKTSVWNGLGEFVKFTLGGGVMNKKALIYGSAVAAIAIVIAARVTGFPPMGGGAGTIGGVGGVEQASRYRGRSMSQSDVTTKNPEVAALFQNHDILTLVRSDAFREAMANDAFRRLQANEAYRQVLASDAYRHVMESDAYRQLSASDAYRQLNESDAYRQIMASDAFRQLQANDAFRQLQASDAFRQLQASDAFRSLSRSPDLADQFMREAMRAQQ